MKRIFKSDVFLLVFTVAVEFIQAAFFNVGHFRHDFVSSDCSICVELPVCLELMDLPSSSVRPDSFFTGAPSIITLAASAYFGFSTILYLFTLVSLRTKLSN